MIKKAVFFSSLVFLLFGCFLIPGYDLSGNWRGTSNSTNYGTYSLNLTLIQNGDSVTGTWSSNAGGGGNVSATISGDSIRGTLSGFFGSFATVNGTISNGGNRITGSGTETGGSFSFSVNKI